MHIASDLTSSDVLADELDCNFPIIISLIHLSPHEGHQVTRADVEDVPCTFVTMEVFDKLFNEGMCCNTALCPLV